jgi:hypothetical protein
MVAREPPPLLASRLRDNAFGLRRSIAFAVSIALHLAVLYALGALSWTTPEPEREGRISVIWFEDWRAPDEQREAPPQNVEPEEPVARARPPEPPAPSPEAQPAPEEPPAEQAPDEPPPTVPAQAGTAPRIDPLFVEEASDPVTDTADSDPSINAIELAEARSHVIERMREDRQREAGYRSFSLDDVLAERPPAHQPPPERVARPWPPCPIVERRTVQFAMIMAGVCFRTREPTDLLSRLQLDYRQGLPVCEPVTDGDGNETYKCRLVPADQR